MTSRTLIAAAVLSLLAVSGCSTGATNTTYARVGQSGPSAVSIPLN